jgi:hypothetical protein
MTPEKSEEMKGKKKEKRKKTQENLDKKTKCKGARA